MEQSPALILAFALGLMACGSPEQRLAERALHQGVAAYHDSAYQVADSAFALAPDDARAVYDRGVNGLALHGPVYAAEHFGTAARLDSGNVRPLAFYNSGAAQLQEAREAESTIARITRDLERTAPTTDDINDRLHALVQTDSLRRESHRLEGRIDTALTGSIEAFKNSLRHDPDQEDARHNLMLAMRLWAKRQKDKARDGDKNDKDKEKALTERARLLLEKADELVDAFRFQEALRVLQDGLKQEPSLSTKKEYMDKLDLVTKAAQAS
ncbi:MAG: hypothetical protein H6591_12685 [Flavobacteriales bacterium]|nr:hypothetical protein [Flavobacteriales bacterium]